MTQTRPIQTTGNRLVFEDSIQVQAPIGEVYRRWTDFQRFPEFMSNVEEVRPLGGDRYHWVARIFGVKQEWDAEVIDQQPNSRVSWRSISGPYNQGTVSFSQLGTGNTEIRLRLEYAVPLGKAGQALDQITQTTKREVMEDLNNFRKLLTGQRDEYMFLEGEKISSGPVGLLARIIVPATLGVAGAFVGRALEKRARESNPFSRTTSPVKTPAATAGWVFTAASAASIATSAILRARGDRKNSLFVGQWAPTLLSVGAAIRLLGRRDRPHTPLKTGITASLLAAAAGTSGSSLYSWLRGYPRDAAAMTIVASTLSGAATAVESMALASPRRSFGKRAFASARRAKLASAIRSHQQTKSQWAISNRHGWPGERIQLLVLGAAASRCIPLVVRLADRELLHKAARRFEIKLLSNSGSERRFLRFWPSVHVGHRNKSRAAHIMTQESTPVVLRPSEPFPLETDQKVFMIDVGSTQFGFLYVDAHSYTLGWDGILDFNRLDEEVVDGLLPTFVLAAPRSAKEKSEFSTRTLTSVYATVENSTYCFLKLENDQQFAQYQELMKHGDLVSFVRYDVRERQNIEDPIYAFTAENPDWLDKRRPGRLAIRVSHKFVWSKTTMEWVLTHHIDSLRLRHELDPEHLASALSQLMSEVLP